MHTVSTKRAINGKLMRYKCVKMYTTSKETLTNGVNKILNTNSFLIYAHVDAFFCGELLIIL